MILLIRSFILYTIFISLLFCNVTFSHDLKRYKLGDPITLECKDIKGEWGPGPTCLDSNNEIKFFYGRDVFLYCSVLIDSQEFYNKMIEYSNQNDAWQCRVLVSPDETLKIYYPLQIPIWGIQQTNHLDVAAHVNFALHAEEGLISAVSIYPVKDHHTSVQPKSIINFHGHVKWFKGPSFEEFSGYQSTTGGSDDDTILPLIQKSNYFPIAIYSLVTLLFTVLIGSVAYKFCLKPRLIRKYLKTD